MHVCLSFTEVTLGSEGILSFSVLQTTQTVVLLYTGSVCIITSSGLQIFNRGLSLGFSFDSQRLLKLIPKQQGLVLDAADALPCSLQHFFLKDLHVFGSVHVSLNCCQSTSVCC